MLGRRFSISTFETCYGLAMQFVLAFDWPVTVSHYNREREIGLCVDDNRQVVVNSSPSQWIHSVIGQLSVLSLVLAPDIIFSVEI